MSRIGRSLERVKLVGKVVKKPSITLGRGIGCWFELKVKNDEGGYDTYEVIITKGRKPWRLTEGAEVCAVGILIGNRLWADYFTEYKVR